MRARSIGAVTVCAAALLLGACGGDDDDTGDDGASEQQQGGRDEGRSGAAGTYEGELEDGSELRVRLDVDATDDAVAPFEAFRVEAGGPAVTWIVAEITVPEGVDGTGRFITFVADGVDPLDDDPLDDADGITNAEFACSLLDDWAEASGDASAVADAYLELYEGPCGRQTLQVLAPGGETTTYVMAYEGPLPDFAELRSGLFTELRPA